ncbi:E3 ubiquitin-protein ligase ZNRF2 isoform X1 [Neocloeon triangulifer]|uniref:E3 ubiquitin-protein ligase ZNRF2 isoform X1 n=1 Tax=Neocloeon triangulifer TaxID=2078957 RepID=UPI00286EEFE8|nr:E3 ubiquitin-protein ligase ZNRF2 isoform X1 [Neocloeon triangulifer]
MGAKPSTAAGGASSPRARTFSASSSADVVNASASGFSLLRALPDLAGAVSSDRLRARSLSSVPQEAATGAGGRGLTISESPAETDSSSEEQPEQQVAAVAAAGLGISTPRVYAAHSLPSHIWSLNGIKCPVCSKFVLPDDIECHLVMCLTKPRLSYNEDVLSETKGECVICFEELEQGDTIARLPCLCIYHKQCIDQWFNINRSCPEHPGD